MSLPKVEAQKQDIAFVDKSFDGDRLMAGVGVLWTTQDKTRSIF